MDWCRNIGGCSNAAAFQAAWISISSDPSTAIIRYPRSAAASSIAVAMSEK